MGGVIWHWHFCFVMENASCFHLLLLLRSVDEGCFCLKVNMSWAIVVLMRLRRKDGHDEMRGNG